MSTIVCQNLVSCFESQLTETTTTTTLKLKVAPPAKNLEFGNWATSFQSKSIDQNDTNNNFYVHPLSSFSRLSARSLELCTENLGSETGCDNIITDTNNIFSSKAQTTRKVPKKVVYQEEQKTKSFPPPLTSSLQVVRHRQGGRLIIEAVEAPLRNTYLQAERSDGRLRLCYLNTTSHDDDEEEEEEQKEEEEEEEEEEYDEEELNENNLNEKEEIEGELNLEMEIENYKRMSRCNGNGALCASNNWKPALWVATS